MRLNENFEYKLNEIDEDTREILKLFQEVLRTTLTFTHNGKNIDKRGGFNSLKDFKLYRNELKKYHNYPFAKRLQTHLAAIEKELIASLQSERASKKAIKHGSQGLVAAKKHLMAGDRSAFLKTAMALSGAAKSPSHRSTRDILKHAKNPFYIENPLIFQSNTFLRQFEKSDMLYVINKDLDKYKYSYMKLPASAHTDYQFIAYFIMNLKSEPGSVELGSAEISNFFKIAYSDRDYASLTQKVERYLRNNDKTLLPEIFEEMKQFPELVKANRELCAKHTTVYRGVAFEDDTTEEKVIERDKRTLVVATSTHRIPAKRFAMSYGHLESESSARTDGVVIEYDVSDPDAVILDVSVFGGIFMESEVLINPRKARVVGTRTYWRDGSED